MCEQGVEDLVDLFAAMFAQFGTSIPPLTKLKACAT